jgi:DNA-binding protein H-NS
MNKTTASALADAQALISTLETPYLQELQGFLSQEIRRRYIAARTDAIAEIHKIIAAAGLTKEEVQALMAGKPKAWKLAKRGAADIKFRHPVDETKQWSGRGRTPLWVKKWKLAHGNVDALKIAA